MKETSLLEKQEILIKLTTETMPFGKYAGTKLMYLPETYLIWFSNQGFPHGELGEQLALMFEIKVNGLEYLLNNILKRRT